MGIISRFLDTFKDVFESTVEQSQSDRIDDSPQEESRSIEGEDNQSVVEESIAPAIDYCCIESDFTNDMLSMEMMRLGHDPANMSRKQMIDTLYEYMESKKPISASENAENDDDIEGEGDIKEEDD